MPRERIILCQRTPAPTADHTSTGRRGIYHVAVDIGWAANSGHVSMQFVGLADDTSETFAPDEPYAEGMSFMQLNALIKLLRKARDGAFGKPE